MAALNSADWLRFAALALALGAIAAVLLYTVIAGVPPTPPGRRLRRALFSLLPADGEIDGVIYDLGAGWGGLALGLAARYRGFAVRGVELSPLPWLAARLRAMVVRPENLAFQRGDFFKYPLGDAGLVVCYLFPAEMARLEEKLACELAPGTPVLSLVFAFPTWKAERVVDVGDLYHSRVYLYRAPGPKEC